MSVVVIGLNHKTVPLDLLERTIGWTDLRAENEAMRALLHSAGWQWAAWMLAGFGLLHLVR